MRALALPLLALLAALPAFADSPAMPEDAEVKWKAEIADANAAYATKPTAILKIDDAIYLKPGQTGYLTATAEGSHTWALEKSAGDLLSVAASEDLASAMYQGKDGSDDLAKAEKPHELGGGLRLTAGKAQIEPGKDGMRVAVYNDANPKAAAFTGLDYYPYDTSFVVEAKFEPSAALVPKVFQTSRGWYKQFYYAGDAVFSLKGADVRLPMYAGSDKLAEIDSLAVFIMDDTTGKETYGVGRYVDVEIAKGALPSAVKIDFNFLYNPNCARSPHYNCPVAVDRVALAVTAGEKKPAEHP